MSKGYTLDRGFLFDYAWEHAMRLLSPQDFHRVFWTLCEYQRSGGKTDPLDENDATTAGAVLSLILPQIDNRLRGSIGGTTARGTVPGTVPATVPGTVLKEEDEIRGNELKGNELSGAEDIGASAPSSSVSEREILNLFRELCPSLVQPKGLTQAIRTEIAGCPSKSREELAELFRRAEALPLCRGESGREKKFSLGGVLRNAEQILGGAFDPYEEAKKEKPDSAAFGAADVEYWNSIARARGAEEA